MAIEKKPKIVKKTTKTSLLKDVVPAQPKDNTEFEATVIANEKLSDLDWWALTAYVINPNPVFLWKCTHDCDGLSDGTISARAKQWLANNYVKKAIAQIMANFSSGKSYIPLTAVMKIKELHGDGVDSDGAEDGGLDKEKMIKALEKRLRDSNYTDDKAASALIDLNRWKKEEDNNSDDHIFNECNHFYTPITCDKCNRMGTVACGGCSFQKEAADNLTEEEREWIKENDSI